MQGIIQTKPIVTETIYKEVDANVSVSKAHRNAATKKALKVLKEYAMTYFPDVNLSSK